MSHLFNVKYGFTLFSYSSSVQMLQPVEFNQAVNYVNKIRVSQYLLCVHGVQFLYFLFLESISKSARYLQIIFGDSSHLSEGTEDNQRGSCHHVCGCSDIATQCINYSFESTV